MSITAPHRNPATTPAARSAKQQAKQEAKQAAKAERAMARAQKRAGQDRMPAGHRPLLPRLAGGLLIAGPLLLTGGSLTSPPQDSGSNADYIASLARDHGQTALSAGLFHYGWIAIALGVLAAAGLVPGRRGRAVTAIGAVLTAFGAIQMSGLLFNDWFLSALGRYLPNGQAVQVFEGMGDAWITSWLLSAQVLALGGMPVLFAGLARAGVVGWWTAPVAITPFVAGVIVTSMAGPAVGLVVGLVCWAPVFLVATRLIRRPAAPSVTV